MFNLYPAIREVNDGRGNYSMEIIEGDIRKFGKCDVGIKSQEVEPIKDFRGEIASTFMYIDAVYPVRGIISKKNRTLFDEWDQTTPVDEWEYEY